MKLRHNDSNLPRRHRGPRADELSDSETLTVLLVGELCQCLCAPAIAFGNRRCQLAVPRSDLTIVSVAGILVYVQIF